jgi:hypothetical protein
MGTPVKIRAREDQCMGAGPCSDPRPMTEEEMLKYYTKEEIDRMGSKIKPPAKEKLIEVLAERTGKTKALYHAVKVFAVSAPVVSKWIKEYGIEFDADGKVICEYEEFKELDKQMQEITKVVGDGTINVTEAIQTGDVVISKGELTNEDEEIGIKAKGEIKPEGTINITGQETKEIPVKIGYVEYEVGKSTVIVDYRSELVAINGMELLQDEADAIADLLINIL